MKEALIKSVPVEFRGSTTNVKFPNIGQSIEIEQIKQIMTGGRYAMMAFGATDIANKLLDVVDATSYFAVLIDGFYKKMGVKGYSDISELEMDDPRVAEMLKAYQETYQPYFNELYMRIDRPEEALKKSKKEEEGEDIKNQAETDNDLQKTEDSDNDIVSQAETSEAI